MRNRLQNRFGSVLVAVVIIAALVLVLNPELRALLLFADSLGLDLLALLLATQLKNLVDLSRPAANEIITSVCGIAFYIGNGAMRTYPKALAWRPFDKLVCPALVFVTLAIRCRLANQ